MSTWLDTVKKTFKDGRKKSASYKFKDALTDAKKVYNKGSNVVVGVARKTRKTMKRGMKKMTKNTRRRRSKGTRKNRR